MLLNVLPSSYWLLILRILAATLGGYIVAALFSVAALGLPLDTMMSLRIGMMGSFIIWAGVATWSFITPSLIRLWGAIGLAACGLLLVATYGIH
ncbi:iron uptake protein [Vreelandella alkaliphila]|uniref:Iron uptake protein n=1 Tax=Vreelandella alkaliphila TaxID=272774 RepID=A0ABX4HHU7_9GAMM|nr:iron uptake protein [Halomonas humidisoli]PAU71953.1 iron uptake protein [Halomonas humidisoli]